MDRLAGRISGDSTVAFAWAYCMALESACACDIPPRAAHLRALLLERERVANHLGDLGALGNDAAFAFGLAQFSRLREDWLRLSRELFGHRLMMDCVLPGGVSVDLDRPQAERLRLQCDAVEREVRTLQHICLEVADVAEAGEILRRRTLPAGCKPPTALATGVNGKRQINYYDPDGTRVEVMEPGTFDGKPRPPSTARPPVGEKKPAPAAGTS